MQLFADYSEEGNFVKGLSLYQVVLDLKKKTFESSSYGLELNRNYAESKLFKNIYDNQDFYFVHRYFYECKLKLRLLTNYGINFTSAIQLDNIYGVQFPP